MSGDNDCRFFVHHTYTNRLSGYNLNIHICCSRTAAVKTPTHNKKKCCQWMCQCDHWHWQQVLDSELPVPRAAARGDQALPYGIEVMVSKMPVFGVLFGLAHFGDTAIWLRRIAAFV